MPPGKAAKKATPKKVAPKKSAPKKAAKKSAGHRRGQELRHCYEHFGRVAALQPMLPESSDVARMAGLAPQLLRGGQASFAADLLRAAEHLCFGTLALQNPVEGISEELSTVLEAECSALLERADQHAAEGLLSAPVQKLFTAMRRNAVRASKQGHLRAASELARGTEALSHVSAEFTGRLYASTFARLEMA